MPCKKTNLRLSPPLSDLQIGKLYRNTVLRQEFYSADYAHDWHQDETPWMTLATMITDYFKPSRVVDVGCGIGKVVHYLRNRGIQAHGCDFSEAFFRLAPGDTQNFLCVADVTKLPYRSQEFDFVLCTEVLEHLPVSLGNKAVAELKRICRGTLFVTIPSYGPNEYGPYGLPIREGCWLEDARQERRFQNIVVDEDGLPDCGHLTLATYRWWTRRFLSLGLARHGFLERRLNSDKALDLQRWHWNLYVLRSVTEPSVALDNDLTCCLSDGWYAVEDWGKVGKIRWTAHEAHAYLYGNPSHRVLSVEFHTGHPDLLYPRSIELYVDTFDSKVGEFEQIGQLHSTLDVDQWIACKVPVRLSQPSLLRVRLVVPKTFVPAALPDSSDDRELGVAVRQIGLLADEAANRHSGQSC